MYDGRKIVGIIPARGGSKRLPGKNIMELNSKPLITWSIEAALASCYLDRVIVSTDDPEIAAVAEADGAGVPFLRPPELADDSATSVDVLLHAYRHLIEHGDPFDVIALLQPTSPLRTGKDIDAGIRLFSKRKAQSIISVAEDRHHWWANTLGVDGCMKDFLPEERLVRSQELPPAYRLNGALYVVDAGFLVERNTLFGTRTYAYIMPKERSVDIDDITDFRIAEALMASQG